MSALPCGIACREGCFDTGSFAFSTDNFANNAPIARMITATVERNSEVVITFQGYDVDGDKVSRREEPCFPVPGL